MKKLLLTTQILIAILGMSTTIAQSAELVTFSNGKVADANDVNHNFQELAARITTHSAAPGLKGDKGDKGDTGAAGSASANSSHSTLSFINQRLSPSSTLNNIPYPILESQSCPQKTPTTATATIAGKVKMTITDLLGYESISNLFEFSFIANSANDVEPASLIGSSANITITTSLGSKTVNGIVNKIGKTYATNGNAIYVINIQPSLSQLQLSNNYQIFQEMSASDIIQNILSNAGITPDTSFQNNSKIFEMSMMYNQSPFNYLQQLTQSFGIAYFFNGDSVMFTDNTAAYLDSGATLSFIGRYTNINNLNTETQAYAFEYFKAQENTAEKATSAGVNFQSANTVLLNTQGIGQSEKYSFDFIHTTQDDVSSSSNINIARENTRKNQHFGNSNHPLIQAGYRFNINNKTGSLTGSYLASHVEHALTLSSDGNCLVYANSFNSQPSNIAFTPELTTPKTKVGGVTTAIVVGPAGETKYTDEYGRVKVQFHWDRQGSNDENSSAWIRVAVPVDRLTEKLLYVPLIGTEVLVSFLNGDPNSPIITGSLYNSNHMPPLQLPANKFSNGGEVISDLPL